MVYQRLLTNRTQGIINFSSQKKLFVALAVHPTNIVIIMPHKILGHYEVPPEVSSLFTLTIRSARKKLTMICTKHLVVQLYQLVVG